MKDELRYVIFETGLGWFGLLGDGKYLIRCTLPVADEEIAREYILGDRQDVRCDGTIFVPLQNRIKAYFAGGCDDFGDVKVRLEGLSGFTVRVLEACRKVPAGKTVTYGELASLAGSPKAARAVGGAMGANPVPLIIPCHRVIKSDGKLGGFSAQGGTELKKRMLEMESEGL